MNTSEFSRRSFLVQIGAIGGAVACSAHAENALAASNPVRQGRNAQSSATSNEQATTRVQRMAWWHDAKFGMFIHWGLYSLLGQQEWAMEVERIPIPQYELLAKHFHPKPNAAREWAKLAKRAGQRYMVMTTRSEEHTSELQSLRHLVCRLL